MTEQEATRLFEKWRKILHLEAWDIKFQWCVRGRDMPLTDSLGCASYTYESRQAIIRMLDQVDFENKLFEYDYERTLVHEMLHLKFAGLDDSGDTLRDKLTHQLIDDLARAFVSAQRQNRVDTADCDLVY